jgi:hypothetical protein
VGEAGYAHAGHLTDPAADWPARLAADLRQANATIGRIRRLCDEATADGNPVVTVATVRVLLAASDG